LASNPRSDQPWILKKFPILAFLILGVGSVRFREAAKPPQMATNGAFETVGILAIVGRLRMVCFGCASCESGRSFEAGNSNFYGTILVATVTGPNELSQVLSHRR
jgi:hypothetical protein